MQHVCTTASTATSFASNIVLLSKSTHSKCSLNYSSTTAPEQQQLQNKATTYYPSNHRTDENDADDDKPDDNDDGEYGGGHVGVASVVDGD